MPELLLLISIRDEYSNPVRFWHASSSQWWDALFVRVWNGSAWVQIK